MVNRPASDTVRFRVLGPLDVRGSEPVTITARRQRVVLALLLLRANQMVLLDSLIDAIWNGSPPTTARAQVQTAVSALRRLLARAGLGERIRMHGLGYTMDVAADELDLMVFTELVNCGRAAATAGRLDQARSAFRSALALWRGRPLSDVDSEAVRARASQIAEHRVEVLEKCLDVELALGLHHEVVSELHALCAENPLRERPASQLMTALYRCGRQAEALAIFQRVRKTFIEELGLEPSPALQRLERAILTGDSQLDLPSAAAVTPITEMPVPRMLPPRLPDFTGRAALLRTLRGRLSGNRGTPASPVLVLTGFVGVGKSAIAIEVAHEMAGDFPDGQLYARIAPSAESAMDVLERFLRALGFAPTAIPDSLDGRAALYRSALAERRILVLVEDATDETQLRALLPATSTCRLIVTSRTRMAALPGADVFEIDRLDAHDSLDLLGALIGWERIATEPSKAIELVERCSGLPLALRIAATRLSARPHWSVAQLTDRLADPAQRFIELTQQGLELRAGLDATYAALPPDAKRLLAHLGETAAETFAVWVAAPLLQMEPEPAAEVLETLVDARLVNVVAGSGVTARFQLPDLVRLHARYRAATETSTSERGEAFRRLLGAWLSLAGEAGLRQDGRRPVSHPDLTPWPLAAPLVDNLLADPTAWYEVERPALLAVVRQAAQAGEVTYCWSLARAVAALAEAQGRLADWRETVECALRATVSARDRLGEAVMLHSLGRLELHENRPEQAAGRLRAALAAFEQLDAVEWIEITTEALHALRPARDQLVRPVTGAPTRHRAYRYPARQTVTRQLPFRRKQFGFPSEMRDHRAASARAAARRSLKSPETS